jgi:acetyl esterase/lipase
MNAALAKRLPGGISTQVDIAYGIEPIEKLDVYVPAALAGSGQTKPAILWIHGGGFISGGKSQVANYLKIIAASGYPVVGVDYALAPAARHPEPTRQVNAALAFIRANAQRFNIDPDRIFLAGDSAGAQIAAQLALAISEPDYARLIGVTPAIARSALRGLILYCGIYDPDSMSAEGPMAGFLKTVAWSYLGTRDAAALPQQFSIVRNMTKTMPPMFVTAGNADPLLPHSKSLVATATKLGVTVDALFFPDDFSPPLQHEYQFDLDVDAGQKALQRSLKFVLDYGQ